MSNRTPPEKKHTARRLGTGLHHAACALLIVASVSCSQAQAPALPPGTPQHWIEQAAGFEQSIIQNDGVFPLRYRIHKIDAKGDIVREVIESREGTVARLIQRDGRPLTSAEDKAEQQRLGDILRSPEDFIRHHKKDATARGYSISLVKLLPTAIRYAYTPGQPQPPGSFSPQVVIDFSPDPNFKPPTTPSEILTGIQGRFWIDGRTGRMTRAEARVIHPVDFGWGMLARIHEGGTIMFQQTEVGQDRWAYSALEEHFVIRELLLKTVAENTRMSSFDFRLLPAPVSFQDAVRTLLAMPVPTR